MLIGLLFGISRHHPPDLIRNMVLGASGEEERIDGGDGGGELASFLSGRGSSVRLNVGRNSTETGKKLEGSAMLPPFLPVVVANRSGPGCHILGQVRRGGVIVESGGSIRQLVLSDLNSLARYSKPFRTNAGKNYRV